MQKEQGLTLELFAEELPNQADLTATPLGTWASATTFSCASTPYSTASSGACASSFG